ncbi:hypothetical protein AKJ18_29365 [Vibrio xuii]|nr:hypothetical protein AKJ18_29365 [Vibrio xuii]
MGDKDTVALGLDQDTYVTLPRGQAKNLKASFVLEKELKAPIMKGDVVGKLYYQLEDSDIAEYPLLALEDVEQGSLFSRLWDYIVMLVKSFL